MKQKPVIFWLKSGIVMIMIMIMIGGITRLTGSGLSITEWRVVGGTIPPIGDEEWQIAFKKYQQTPEFILRILICSLKDLNQFSFGNIYIDYGVELWDSCFSSLIYIF